LTQLDCPAARDDIDAYAIGALDAEEARALEAHLSRCSDCSRLAEDARESGTMAVAMTAPLASSSPALKARVMASAAVLTDATSRPRHGARRWQAAAAALVAAVIAIFAWGMVMQRRVDRLDERNAALRADATAQSTELARVHTELQQMTDFNARLAGTVGTQDAILDVVTQPDVRRTPMTGTAVAPRASARYLWSPAQEVGALMAQDLPSLGAGQTYQMWVVYADKWVSGGSFSVDASGAGRLVVRTAEQGEPAGAAPSWFCVTIEASGGTTGHTGAMVLRGSAQ